jgi:hypothetical protein
MMIADDRLASSGADLGPADPAVPAVQDRLPRSPRRERWRYWFLGRGAVCGPCVWTMLYATPGIRDLVTTFTGVAVTRCLNCGRNEA